jgi:hypothetical protein
MEAQIAFTVKSTADDQFAHAYDDPNTPADESVDGTCWDFMGRCTLRAAIEEAELMNQYPVLTITAVGTLLIDQSQPGFGLPDHSVLKGSNQGFAIQGNGSSVNLGLSNDCKVSGIRLKGGLYGMIVGGDDNRVGGTKPEDAVWVEGADQAGIFIAGNNNRIIGSVIGIDEFNLASPNHFGLFLTGSNNQIGGDSTQFANVISGNQIGIGVYTLNGTNYIQGNLIGTDVQGSHAVPNLVGIDNIGPELVIGGPNPAQANTISGNTQNGIILGDSARHVRVYGNRIGTNPTGSYAIPNGSGLSVAAGSTNCEISYNTIKFNTNNGVQLTGITGIESGNNKFVGNLIANNGHAGMTITGDTHDNVIGTGLTGPIEDPNIIKDNGDLGIIITLEAGVPQRNTIRRNSFENNNTVGIEIEEGQGNIAAPILTLYTDDGQGVATIEGVQSSIGAIIDAYAGVKNASGHYEGVEWLGQGTVGPNGNFAFFAQACVCDTIVATATDMLGNTSEFSEGLGMTTAVIEPGKELQVKVSPNPFRSLVEFSFTVREAGDVVLKVYDAMGKEMATVVKDHLQQGDYKMNWSPVDLGYTSYYYKLIMGNKIYSGEVIHLE